MISYVYMFVTFTIIIIVFILFSNHLNSDAVKESFEVYNSIQLKDTIYETAIKEVFDTNQNMICNILPNMVDCKNKSITINKFPVHIIKDFNNKIVAVFNDGLIYTKTGYADPFWSGPLPYSAANDIIPLRMITLSPDGLLYGVGFDNKLYRKDNKNIESKWIAVPYSNDIIYILYNQVDGKNDTLLAINVEGYLTEKHVKNAETTDFKMLTNDNLQVIKILFSKSGNLIGIGKDLKLYQKITTDYKTSQFDTTGEKNPSIVLDVIYDNDGKFIGLVPLPTLGYTEIRKQKIGYYKSAFIPVELSNALSNDNNDKQILNLVDIIKSKNGFDMNFTDVDIVDSDINIESAKHKIEMDKLTNLRKYCAERRGGVANNNVEDYDLLNKMEEYERKIIELKKSINSYVEIDPNRTKIQEEIIGL